MMRDYVTFYLNGEKKKVFGEEVFLPLSTYLREVERLTGTKVVCAEGDCGACTVLKGSFFGNQKEMKFQTINSCIFPVFLADGSHIISVEGLNDGEELGPVQKAMVDHHGSQCGFCTPGFVASLTALALDKKDIDEKKVRNYLTGNLCRCTGYKGIIEAGNNIDSSIVRKKFKIYLKNEIISDLKKEVLNEAFIEDTKRNRSIFLPKKLKEALDYKKSHKNAKIVSAATDLYVLFNKEKWEPTELMSLHLISDLYEIKEDSRSKEVIVGARVTLTEVENYLAKKMSEFSNLLHVFASPQIKNAGTLVGNIANASPIGDTLPFLLVMNAKLKLSNQKGSRLVSMNDFYKGYKTLDLKSDEIITSVHIPQIAKNIDVKVYKVSKRKDLDISTVSLAFYLQKDKVGEILDLRIGLGGVAATPIRMKKVEKWALNKMFTTETVEKIITLVKEDIAPLSDMRGSSEYRVMLVENLLRKAHLEICSEGGCAHE